MFPVCLFYYVAAVKEVAFYLNNKRMVPLPRSNEQSPQSEYLEETQESFWRTGILQLSRGIE